MSGMRITKVTLNNGNECNKQDANQDIALMFGYPNGTVEIVNLPYAILISFVRIIEPVLSRNGIKTSDALYRENRSQENTKTLFETSGCIYHAAWCLYGGSCILSNNNNHYLNSFSEFFALPTQIFNYLLPDNMDKSKNLNINNTSTRYQDNIKEPVQFNTALLIKNKTKQILGNKHKDAVIGAEQSQSTNSYDTLLYFCFSSNKCYLLTVYELSDSIQKRIRTLKRLWPYKLTSHSEKDESFDKLMSFERKFLKAHDNSLTNLNLVVAYIDDSWNVHGDKLGAVKTLLEFWLFASIYLQETLHFILKSWLIDKARNFEGVNQAPQSKIIVLNDRNHNDICHIGRYLVKFMGTKIQLERNITPKCLESMPGSQNKVKQSALSIKLLRLARSTPVNQINSSQVKMARSRVKPNNNASTSEPARSFIHDFIYNDTPDYRANHLHKVAILLMMVEIFFLLWLFFDDLCCCIRDKCLPALHFLLRIILRWLPPRVYIQ